MERNLEPGALKASFDRMCDAKQPASDGISQYIETLNKTLLLGDDQKKNLTDYRDAQAKALADSRSAICAQKPDLSSFEAALNFRQKMVEQQLDVLKTVNPKLLTFYNSLNGEQKARFDAMRQNMASHGREARRR
jgi:predicted  nucleic acid-binding Zn-ribbon protein